MGEGSNISATSVNSPSFPLHLANVLWRLFQVPQLGHGVVAEGLVQRTISKFISNIHVGSFLHQQLRVCVCVCGGGGGGGGMIIHRGHVTVT